MRLVFPGPAADVALDELYGVPRQRHNDRPWVGLCMIASLDGSTVIEGRSGLLGNPTDTAVLGALRRAADAIIVGAATVRQEAYGPPRKPGQRLGVVTSTGDVDPGMELFTSGAGFLIMPEDGPQPASGRHGRLEIVRAGHGRVDVALALRRLDRVMDPPVFVQAEGGPRLNGSLLDAECVDELDLTVSPVLVGADGPRLTVGGRPATARFDLVHLGVDDEGYLYTRWTRAPT
jgi:riboflavin biosynthesis pyrimidine reductase